MIKASKVFLIGLLLFSCKENTADDSSIEEKVEFNQQLADELKSMAEVDQIAAYIPEGDLKIQIIQFGKIREFRFNN